MISFARRFGGIVRDPRNYGPLHTRFEAVNYSSGGTWEDSSGYNHDLAWTVQPASTSQSSEVKGNKVINLGSGYGVTGAFTALAKPITVIWVAKVVPSGVANVLFDGNSATTLMCVEYQSATAYVRSSTVMYYTSVSRMQSAHSAFVVFNGANSRIGINTDTAEVSGDTGSATNITAFSVGSGASGSYPYGAGWLAEINFFAGSLTQRNLSGMLRGVLGKYF